MCSGGGWYSPDATSFTIQVCVASRSRDLCTLSEGALHELRVGVGAEMAAWEGMVGARGCVLTGAAFLTSRSGRFRGGGSGGGGGGLYSPGAALFGGSSVASMVTRTSSCVPTSLSCSSWHLVGVSMCGACSPTAASTSPATRSCFPVSFFPVSLALPHPPSRCSHPLSGVCLTGSDGGVGCGLMERDSGCACTATVTTSRLSVAGLSLEMRLAAWYLLCLMTSLSSASFLSSSFQALSCSRASRSSGPLLLNLRDVASLLLEVSFWEPLKAGMKSVELAPKQLLSKTGW